MDAAEEFESSTKSRGEELHALATAKKIITESTGGAAGQSYSFLQFSSEADRFVKDLARKTNDAALAQLASRMSSAVRMGSAAGEDPFAKVKGLIADMIATLEGDAEADASHDAYCNKEMAAANSKKDELKALSDKLSTK